MRTSYIGGNKWVITTGRELGIKDINNNLITFSTQKDAQACLNVIETFNNYSKESK